MADLRQLQPRVGPARGLRRDRHQVRPALQHHARRQGLHRAEGGRQEEAAPGDRPSGGEGTDTGGGALAPSEYLDSSDEESDEEKKESMELLARTPEKKKEEAVLPTIATPEKEIVAPPAEPPPPPPRPATAPAKPEIVIETIEPAMEACLQAVAARFEAFDALKCAIEIEEAAEPLTCRLERLPK